MYNLVQCTRCRKKMLDEEYSTHHCMPKIKEWKTIKFTNHYIVENEDGVKTISFVSQDGVNYDFIEILEEKEYTKIPYQPIEFDTARRKFTERRSDDDLPEPISEIFINNNLANVKYN